MDRSKLPQAQTKKIKRESQKLGEITASVNQLYQMLIKPGHCLPFLSVEAKMKLSYQHRWLSLALIVSLGILSP